MNNQSSSFESTQSPYHESNPLGGASIQSATITRNLEAGDREDRESPLTLTDDEQDESGNQDGQTNSNSKNLVVDDHDCEGASAGSASVWSDQSQRQTNRWLPADKICKVSKVKADH